jgi:Protein of unknown function (DUF3644)/EC042_2821-lke REase
MGKRGNRGLKGQLLNKSVEAFILALETINRLSTTYRVETFTYLICNAWEILLKARILELNNNNRSVIYFKQRKEKNKKSISLRTCLEKIFPNENDPIRRNIELVADLRDQAVHLVISNVPREILALFQSSVLNYHKCLIQWFDISLSERLTIGMMTIVYDFKPEEFDLTNPIMRRNMGIETADYLMKYQSQLKSEFEKLGKVAEFSIPIDYTLKLTKSGSPDIELFSGTGGRMTNIIEVPKDPGKSHPHRQKDVIEIINKRLPNGIKINPHDITCIIATFDIKKNSAFYYKGSVTGSPTQYSQGFIDWIIQQQKSKSNFFKEARQQYRQAKTPAI